MRRRSRIITTMVSALWSLAVLSLVACSSMDSGGMSKASAPKDGDLVLPADYKSWPTFLMNIDKEQNKQVRDLYINKIGARPSAGQMFPNGTVMVMELYKAKEQADGNLEKGPDGKLVKGDLAKVFIMGKGEGWAKDVPDNIKTGAWVFSAAGPDGKPIAEDFTKCRACHIPLAQKDFVFRYDEYFEKRARM